MILPINIKDSVDAHLGIDISVKNREREYSYGRFLYCALCRRLLRKQNYLDKEFVSLREIATPINRDHSTILHAFKQWDDLVCEIPYYNGLYKTLIKHVLITDFNNEKWLKEFESIDKTIEYYSEKIEKINERHIEHIACLEDEIKSLQVEIDTDIKSIIMTSLNSLTEEQLVNFKETRLDPYIKMNKCT